MLKFGTKMARSFRVALVQLAVTANKEDNLTHAAKQIKEAASKGASVVALPECFNSPYGTGYFAEYSEPIPGPSTDVLKAAAKENNIFLVGGSIPEKDGGKIYNTCTVFDPNGEMIAKHRKMHLFDIDVPGKITFKESDILSPGNSFNVFETPLCKIGIGICYDIRFAEMAQLYAKMGCKMLIYPGAFNMTTGPAHWELLTRDRALDNQLYVATVSPARDESAKYVAWGHSTAVSPWGEVVATCEHEETIVYVDIDLDLIDQIRGQIPIGNQRRNDLYEVIDKTSAKK